MDESICIGNISNYYGGIEVEEKEGKYFWGIEDHSSIKMKEIPKFLFDALIKYEEERK